MITFKRISAELIEGSTKFWNDETMKHEAIWTIKTAPKQNVVFNRDKEIESFLTIKEAKRYIENIELQKGLPVDEIEQGFADGGGWSGGCCITGDGNGFSWYKDEQRNIIRN